MTWAWWGAGVVGTSEIGGQELTTDFCKSSLVTLSELTAWSRVNLA